MTDDIQVAVKEGPNSANAHKGHVLNIVDRDPTNMNDHVKVGCKQKRKISKVIIFLPAACTSLLLQRLLFQ